MTTRLITMASAGAITGGGHWIATLGASGSEIGYGVAVDSSGNIFVTGATTSQGAGGNDILLAKYNTSGVVQWQRTLGGIGTDVGQGVAVDSLGNIYIAGYTNSLGGSGSRDIFIAKYNTSGTIQWQRSLGGTGDDRGYGVAVDSSNNVYVGGWSTSSGGGGSSDFFIVKYNTSGVLQWQRSLGGGNSEYGYAIAVDASGNVYVAGETDQSVNAYDLYITKYNTSGVIQWQKTLGATGSEYGHGVAVDSSGNVYVTGAHPSASGDDDLLLVKYDPSGNLQWQRSLGGGFVGNEYGRGVVVDASGNIYVAGINSPYSGSAKILLLKYDTSGNLQWQRSLDGPSTEYGYGVAVDNSGSVYVVGTTTSTPTGSNDLLLAKLPDDGSLTGTYGNMTYAATTLTYEPKTLTEVVRTLTSRVRTLTDTARTLTDAPATLTESVTTL